MKTLVLLLTLIFLNACSGREYHIAMLKESTSSYHQQQHIAVLQDRYGYGASKLEKKKIVDLGPSKFLIVPR